MWNAIKKRLYKTSIWLFNGISFFCDFLEKIKTNEFEINE